LGACCLGLECVQTTQGDCTEQYGNYLGDGVSCKGDPCSGSFGPPAPGPNPGAYSIVLTGTNPSDPPSGGCCLSGGTCSILSQANCAAQGGQYQGDYLPCPDRSMGQSCSVSYPLDIRYGKCPNTVKPNSGGKLKVHIVGDRDLDALLIDLQTIQLRLCGGTDSILPYKPPRLKDRATPLLTLCGDCSCHKLKKDGILDVDMKFRIPELMALIGSVPGGTSIDVEVFGSLLDGTPFTAHDCLLIDRPGSDDEDGDD
jgi:hypothetical protein